MAENASEGILSKISDMFPAIGSMLLPGVGGIAGTGLQLLVHSLTGDPSPNGLDAIKADPELSLKFEELSKAYLLNMYKAETDRMTLQLEETKAQLSDVQDARKQTTDLASVHSPAQYGAPVVSGIILIGFFVCIDFLFFTDIQIAENRANLLNQLFGALIVLVTGVGNYWLGSSVGSQAKDKMMTIMTGNKQ